MAHPPASSAPAEPARPVGRPVLQIEAQAGTLGTTAEAVRRPILEWLESKHGARLPVEAWSGEPFETAPDEGPLVEAVAHPNPYLWAFRLVDPDRDIPGRNWIVETALSETNGKIQLVMRLSCSARGEIGDFIPSSPSFVRNLATSVGLSSDGSVIATTPGSVDSTHGIEALRGAIGNKNRRLPIIVVSATAPPQESFLVDPDQLAKNLVGIATVYSISFDSAREFTDKVTKPWSVFLGACRIYRPYSGGALGSPYDHLLLLGDTLKGPSGAPRGLRRLCQEAARISVDREDIFTQLPRFNKVRADIALRGIDQRLKAADAPDQQISELNQKIEVLNGQVKKALDMAVEHEEERKQADAHLIEARQENVTLRRHVETLEKAIRSSGGMIPLEQRPDSYQGIPEWVERSFAGRLVLSMKAKRAVVDSEYSDIGLVCDGLELLANEYVNMKRQGGGRRKFDDRCRELYLEDEQISADPRRLKNDQQYWCLYEGREIFTDRHLKKGNSREGRQCLRIYYAWDEETRLVVVGHLTTHLTTTAT